jgi:hypothetical protein
MQGIITIRIKALLLSTIFTGNFLVVCHCSAAAGSSTSAGMRGHCCCHQKARPCREKNRCPGTQAVKFNLMEKKAAATVHLSPADVTVITRDYVVRAVGGWAGRHNASSIDLPPHEPPDRLALYHCYLI